MASVLTDAVAYGDSFRGRLPEFFLGPRQSGSGRRHCPRQLILDLQFELFEPVDQVFIGMGAGILCFQLRFQFGMFCLQRRHMTFVHRVLLFLDENWTLANLRLDQMIE